MKVIEVTRLIAGNVYPAMAEVSARLDELGEGHAVDTVNWANFGYRPEVRFNIAYDDKEILLKYYVRESNTKAEMNRKRQEYFQAGVRLVWEIDPDARTVAVYTGPEQCTTLTQDQTLDGGDVLPGFTLSLRELFAELGRQGQ